MSAIAGKGRETPRAHPGGKFIQNCFTLCPQHLRKVHDIGNAESSRLPLSHFASAATDGFREGDEKRGNELAGEKTRRLW